MVCVCGGIVLLYPYHFTANNTYFLHILLTYVCSAFLLFTKIVRLCGLIAELNLTVYVNVFVY